MLDLQNLLLMVVTVSLLTAFLVLLIIRLGITEYLQINGNNFISELSRCVFCMSFWISLIVSIILVFLSGNYLYLAIPFLATPISRFLIG